MRLPLMSRLFPKTSSGEILVEVYQLTVDGPSILNGATTIGTSATNANTIMNGNLLVTGTISGSLVSGITAVTASSPVNSTGGVTPNISISPGSNGEVLTTVLGVPTWAPASGGGGSVASVTASTPIASSGGSNPNITIASSTGTGAVVLATTPTITTPIIDAINPSNDFTLTGAAAKNITLIAPSGNTGIKIDAFTGYFDLNLLNPGGFTLSAADTTTVSYITGAVGLRGNLAVTAGLGGTGNLSTSGTLAVTGATTLSSTLAVTGATTLSSTLTVTGVTVLSSSTVTLSGRTASTALALNASKNIISVTNTGTGSNVLATDPSISNLTTVTATNASYSLSVTSTVAVSHGNFQVVSPNLNNASAVTMFFGRTESNYNGIYASWTNISPGNVGNSYTLGVVGTTNSLELNSTTTYHYKPTILTQTLEVTGATTLSSTLAVTAATTLGGNQAIKVYYQTGTSGAVNTTTSYALPTGVTTSNLLSMSGICLSNGTDPIPLAAFISTDPSHWDAYVSGSNLNIVIPVTATAVASRTFKITYMTS